MKKASILITEEIKGSWIEELKSKFSVTVQTDLWKNPDQLKNLLPEINALIVRNQTQLSKDIIARGVNLKVIGRAGAGLDNIDVEAASEAGIVVVNTTDQNSISVAEHTIGMMLSLARKLTEANDHVREGYWERDRFMGTELFGKTLGVIGLGRIGFLTTLRAYAFGMKILAYDPFVSPESTVVTETRAKLVRLEDLLSKADFVSCHIPLSQSTKHFFNYKRFCQMKRSAFFLNLSRGEIVDERGLIRALSEGKIGGAGLDVREREPPIKSPLSSMDNVIFTPHIAAFTKEAQERVTAAVCKDIISILEGKDARNFTNFSKPKSTEPSIEEN